MKFELKNIERPSLGLNKIPENWTKNIVSEECIYYTDSTFRIKKVVMADEDSFMEFDTDYPTNNNKTILPRTKRGKEKPINENNLFLNAIGNRFTCHFNGHVCIYNDYLKIDYYNSAFENITIANYTELRNWVDLFVLKTTDDDLNEMKQFLSLKSKRTVAKEGDVFCFKIDRRTFGFGRVILNIREVFLKDKALFDNKNHGLQYMAAPVIVKIYLFKNKNTDIPLTTIINTKSLPSFTLTDYPLFKGQYKIIGNVPLEDSEQDFPISIGKYRENKDLPYGKTLSYLQWGWIQKVNENHEWFDKFRSDFGKGSCFIDKGPTYFEINGFIEKELLDKCIEANSTEPYWDYHNTTYQDAYESERKNGTMLLDIRNPKLNDIKVELFNMFKLDINKTYAENYYDSQQ